MCRSLFLPATSNNWLYSSARCRNWITCRSHYFDIIIKAHSRDIYFGFGFSFDAFFCCRLCTNYSTIECTMPIKWRQRGLVIMSYVLWLCFMCDNLRRNMKWCSVSIWSNFFDIIFFFAVIFRAVHICKRWNWNKPISITEWEKTMPSSIYSLVTVWACAFVFVNELTR